MAIIWFIFHGVFCLFVDICKGVGRFFCWLFKIARRPRAERNEPEPFGVDELLTFDELEGD